MFVCVIPSRMKSVLQWSRLETNVKTKPTCRHTVSLLRSLVHEQVIPVKLSLGCLKRCLQNVRDPTRWLGYGLANGAQCVSRNVT